MLNNADYESISHSKLDRRRLRLVTAVNPIFLLKLKVTKRERNNTSTIILCTKLSCWYPSSFTLQLIFLPRTIQFSHFCRGIIWKSCFILLKWCLKTSFSNDVGNYFLQRLTERVAKKDHCWIVIALLRTNAGLVGTTDFT